jgi:hypothetical protein
MRNLLFGSNKIAWILAQVLIAAVLLPDFADAQIQDAGRDCDQTAKMRIYSSAFIHEETGDLLGYELAVGQASNSGVEALLFVYEGAPADGVPLNGRSSDGKLIIEGEWIEHQVEYPSRKEVVQHHSVKILGKLNEVRFRGTIAIEGITAPEKIQLKRVPQIWMCRSK